MHITYKHVVVHTFTCYYNRNAGKYKYTFSLRQKAYQIICTFKNIFFWSHKKVKLLSMKYVFIHTFFFFLKEIHLEYIFFLNAFTCNKGSSNKKIWMWNCFSWLSPTGPGVYLSLDKIRYIAFYLIIYKVHIGAILDYL